jgi:hypothetical protein
MTLSKKHYVLIAQAICDARKVVERETGDVQGTISEGANAGFSELVRILSHEFKVDNSNFNADTFRTATKVDNN